MAEKKIMTLAAQQHYDEKLKAFLASKDAETLKSAKDYADSLADNYDAAGTAASKVAELTNGLVKANTDAIAKLNDGAGVEGSVDFKIAAAKTELNVTIAAAQAAADQAQDEVDAAEGRLDTAEGKIVTMQGQIDALIAGTYDDTEVRNLIKGNADDIDALEGRADAVEAKVTTLIGDDENMSVRAIANEELTKQLITENAAENLNELREIAAWIQAHPGDAAAMNAAIADLEALIGALPEGVTATTIVAYIQEAVAAEKSRAEGAEAGLSGRIDVIDGNIGEGKVDDRIAAAKSAAVTEAGSAADAKDAQILQSAKDYADSKVAGVDLTGIATNAQNIASLQGRMDGAEGDIDALQAAIADGGSVTLAIADAKRAGTTAQGEVDALEDVVSGINTRVGTAESSISAHGDRLTALETKVGDGFVEITNAEIDAMFVAE